MKGGENSSRVWYFEEDMVGEQLAIVIAAASFFA